MPSFDLSWPGGVVIMLLRTFRVARSPAAARLASGGACRSKHTSMEVNSSGVAIIRLDCQGEKQNTLSDDLVDEFGEILEQLEANSDIKSAVLISGKKDSWIVSPPCDPNAQPSKALPCPQCVLAWLVATADGRSALRHLLIGGSQYQDD